MKELQKVLSISLKIEDVKTQGELQKEIDLNVLTLNKITGFESEMQRNEAYSVVTLGNKKLKEVEKERMKITSILDAKKKEFMDMQKSMTSELVFEANRVAGLVRDYDAEVIKKATELKRLEVEAINQQRIIIAQREAQEEAERQAILNAQTQDVDSFFGEEETEPLPLSPVQETFYIPTVVHQEITKPKGTNMIKKYRVLDFSKVPDSFKWINEEYVKEAMRQGIEIDGIEYYEEAKTIFR